GRTSHPQMPHLRYNIGLLVHEDQPPFRITHFTPEPIGTADLSTWSREVWHCAVTFPCGAVRDGGDWVLSCGVHDRWSELHRFGHEDLERRLVRIAPPSWFQWRGEANEPGLFASIAAGDEYQIRRLDLSGGSVVDVGAHCGSTTFVCRERGAQVVHAWEPVPDNVRLLRANAERIGGVVVHQAAVGR